MTKTGNEKTKIYAVIALLFVAAIIAYFRFGHKLRQPEGKRDVSNTEQSGFTIPELPPWLSDLDTPLTTTRAPYTKPSRDIFAPERETPSTDGATRDSAATAQKTHEAKEDQANPQLSAIMMGASGGLAVIDGEVLRIGETVKGYTVAEIRKNSVLLRKGEVTFVLNIGDY